MVGSGNIGLTSYIYIQDRSSSRRTVVAGRSRWRRGQSKTHLKIVDPTIPPEYTMGRGQ